jgi:hypothetical protein
MLRPGAAKSTLSVVDHWQSDIFTDQPSEMDP